MNVPARYIAVALLTTAAVLTVARAHGQTASWNVTSGTWSTPGNWNPVGVPTGGTTAYIANGGTADITSTGAACSQLLLGNGTVNTASGTVVMTAGSLSVGSYESVGQTGSGAFTQSGGTNSVGVYLFVANNPGSSGTFTLNGSGLLTAIEVIGQSGSGGFTQAGGANVVSGSGNLVVGNNTGSNGTYILTAGSLSCGLYDEVIGQSGSGGFTQTGGTNSVGGLILGSSANSSGTYNLSQSGLLTSALETIGNSGAGSFTQMSGTHSTISMILGFNIGSSGTYNLGGGPLSSPSESVGFSGTGSFTQTGGTNSLYLSGEPSFGLTLGAVSGSGSYTLNAGVLSVSGGGFSPSDYDVQLTVGNSGSGAFTQSGGTTSVSLGSNVYLGYGTGSSGTFTLNGGLLGFTGSSSGLYIGENGTGSFSQTGGTNSVSTTLDLGVNTGSGGNYSLSASGLLTAPSEIIGVSGAGSFTQSGGTNNVGSLVFALGGNSTGTYNLNGGLLVIGSGGIAQGSGSALFNFGSGTLGVTGPWSSSFPMTLTGSGGNSTIDTTGGNISLSGILSGPGGLTKAGSGILTLNEAIPNSVFANAGQVWLGPSSLMTGSLSIAASAIVYNQAAAQQFANFTNGGKFFSSSQSGAYISVGGNFVNQPGGDVQIGNGQTMYLAGGAAQSNSGTIALSALSAAAAFESVGPFTNAAGGTSLISCQNANLYFDGGLTNHGPIAFSAGSNNVWGSVTNSPSATIYVSGGASVAFWGNVVQNGTLNVGTQGTVQSNAIFYGGYSGSGNMTGGGNVWVEGTLQPGDAPAAISFTGNLYMAPTTNTVIEIAGSAAGSGYGQVNVTGTLGLAGDLTVSLANSGYRPSYGTQFDILNFSSLSGSFAAMNGLDLGGRLELVPALTNDALILTAVQGGSGTWNTNGNGNMSVWNNWIGGLPDAAGDTATFGSVISAPRTVTVDVPTTVGGLVFHSGQTYTIAGSNALTLTATGGAALIATTTGSQTISAPLVLDSPLSVTAAPGSVLTITGPVSQSGSQSLTLSGGGELVLSGTGGYTGGTIVTAGTLIAADPDAIADGTSLTVGDGELFGTVISSGAVSSAQTVPATVAAVPEPGTMGLVAAGVMLLALYRRRHAR